MKILITGGAGFIGSHIAEFYSNQNHNVVVYDNLSSGSKQNIKHLKNIELIEDDILNYKRLSKSLKGCDKVFHMAALVSVPESMKNPELTNRINIDGFLNVLKAMTANFVKKIVFASSAAVYGASEICPKRLDMMPEPISPYAITKLIGEYYLNYFALNYGIQGVTSRFFNVFGERQSPDSQYAAAVPIFIKKAIFQQPITIYGDGEQTRDFIYVKDLVNYLDYLSENGKGIYNIGYGQVITINQLVKKIISLTKSSSHIIYEPPRIGDVKYSFADVQNLEKISKDLKLIGFEKGLKATINYFNS